MDKKNKNIALAIMSIIPIKILIHFFFFNETYRISISASRRRDDNVYQYMDENLGYYISNVFSEKLWIFLFIIILFSIAVWYFNYTKDVKIFFNLVINNFNNYFNILRNKIGVNNNHINKNVVKNNTKTNESKFDFQEEESLKDNSKTKKYEVEQKVVDSILRVPWTKMEDVGIVSHYNGKPFNGIALHMDENGKVLQETEVVEGLKHGYSRQYHPNGQLFDEVNFENDKKNGLSREYYESGQLSNEVNFENDKENGLSRQYHENGQLEWEGISKDGNQDGLWKFYHKNGQLSCEANWNDGKKNGLIKSYYESGKLKSELNFKDGKDDGLTKFYYESGLLKQEENWKNGKKVGLTKFYDKRGLLKQDEKAENKKIESKFDFKEEESLKDNSKTKKYEKDSDSPGKIDVLGKTLYKKDISGLKEYFKKNPTMGRVYDDFTLSIRNGLTVSEFLEKSNLLVNDEIRNATALGFTDIVSFLSDMLEINENAELRKDLYAFVEASKILLKIEKEDIENNKEEHQKKDKKVENKKIENDNSYSNKEE